MLFRPYLYVNFTPQTPSLLKNKLSLFLIIVIASVCNAQTPLSSETQDSLSILKLAMYDTKAIVKGAGHVFTGPLRWDKHEWLTAGTIVGGTALLYFVDDETSEYFRDQREDVPEGLIEFGERFGSPQVAYSITAGTYLFGLLTKNENIRRVGVLMTSSAAAAGLLQTVLKSTVGRSRPENNRGKFDFRPFSGQAGWRSFPSGHTILSVTLAHSVAKQFDNIWIKAGIYAVGAVAPAQRLWRGAHWLTDVALSTALSIIIVDSVDNYLNTKNLYPDGRKKNGISWNFNMGLGRAGITGNF